MKTLTPLEAKALRAFKALTAANAETPTTEELSKVIGYSRAYAYILLKDLVAKKALTRIGGRGSPRPFILYTSAHPRRKCPLCETPKKDQPQ